MADPVAPRHVAAEVLATKRLGAHRIVTLSAPGVPERFRPGTFVAVRLPGRTTVLPLWIHQVRATSALGPTLDVVLDETSGGAAALRALPAGARVALTGPLGRPFALPREAVSTVLVGHGRAAAVLFGLGERLRERGCAVTVLLAAEDEAHLLSALEARRWSRAVHVVTADGSVGQRGTVADHLGEVAARAEADVIYAAGPLDVLADVARTAEEVGAWSQVALEVPMACGTGLCHGCPLPVLGEDSVARVLRACHEGPVVRGDRVRWDELTGEPA